MSIKGRLEQLPFPEFVQTLANLGRTGKLTLSRFGQQAFVFLRNGCIIGAASSSVRETVGSLLVSQDLITEEQLLAAVEVQKSSPTPQRLGAVLLEREALEEDRLQEAVRQQTYRVVRELMRWQHGFFEFEALEFAAEDEIEVDVLEMLLAEGLSTERVLLEGAIELDHEFAAELMEEGSASATLVPGSVESLRDLLREIRSPEFTGELATRIRDYCAELLPRCVLFSIEGGDFRGVSFLGQEADSASQSEGIRELSIPVGEPSILADTADRKEVFLGTLPDDPGNRRLLESLGGMVPREVVAIPVIVEDRVVMVLYGDSGAADEPIDSVAKLELLMLQTGLVMERDLRVVSAPEQQPVSTEAVPAEDEFELRWADFRSLLDSDPESIMLLSPECKVLYANRALSTVLGRHRESLVGEDVLAHVHRDDREHFRGIVFDVSQGGAPGGNLLRLSDPEGSWKRYHLLPRAVTVSEGPCVMVRALSTGEIRDRIDPLAGLMDHDAFLGRLQRQVKRSGSAEEAPFALLHLGLTNLSSINVELGWSVCNEILRSSGYRLTLNLRPGDIVSLASDAEFHILLDRLAAPEDGLVVASRMIESMKEPFKVAERDVAVRVRIGVVSSGEGCDSVGKLVRAAKKAFVDAKYESDRAIVVGTLAGD